MDEFRISDEVYNQIKDFKYAGCIDLTEEQKSLINKIIPSELHESYNSYGLCEDCKQIKTYFKWCQICNSQHFRGNFKNWTSGNVSIDKFLQETQLNAKE